MSIPMPANEPDRLAALHAYNILDTAPEPGFEDINALAAQIFQAPVAYVSFIDESRLWLKAKYGLPPDLTQCPREITFCATTICGQDTLLVPDLTQDPRFREYAVVTGEPNFRFYCGMPLITHEGYALGTICVVDFEPRQSQPDQVEAIRRLSRQVVAQLELRRRLIELDRAVRERDDAQNRSETLLLNILPRSIAEELKRNGKVEPRFHRSATILFADFKGFTKYAERLEPAALIGLLHQYFSGFDDLVEAAGLEKLKTIGDAYMCVGGVPVENRSHPVDACLAALRIQSQVAKMKAQRERARLAALEIRIGIHTGPVIAGVVGHKKFTYDIWGDAVNVAARLEAHGEAGRINVSEATYQAVAPFFQFEERGTIEAKNKGALRMFFLNRIKPELSSDAEGILPNARFAEEQQRQQTGYRA